MQSPNESAELLLPPGLEDALVVRRPDAPQHHMTLAPVRGVAVARVGERVLARSTHAVRVSEVGRSAYPPVIYFPEADVDREVLEETNVRTTCPLKGSAAIHDLRIGEAELGGAAWTYVQVHDWDLNLKHLRGRVAFDANVVDVEIDSSRPL